jgi:uncharacterized protein with HEPN domain
MKKDNNVYFYLLIHQYDYVDVEMVWRTIKEDLPAFKDKISEILK